MQLGEMSIDWIKVHTDRLTLNSEIMGARQQHSQKLVIIVEIHAEGISGFGEVPVLSLPNYSYEWFEGSLFLLRDLLLPGILNRGKLSLSSLDWLVGNGAARFAIECALLDLGAKSSRVGIVEFISNLFESKHYVVDRPIYFGATTSAIRDWADTKSEINALLAKGVSRIKLKVDAISLSKLDFVLLTGLNQGACQLILDFNGSLSRDELDFIPPHEGLNISFEEPRYPMTLRETSEFIKRVSSRLLLDESSASMVECVGIANLPLNVGIAFKPFRFGSWIEVNRILEECYRCKTPVYLGGMFESSIGRRFLLALGTHEGFNLVGDIVPSKWYYRRDIGVPIEQHSFGQMRANFSNGIDVESIEGHRCSDICFTVGQ